MFIQLNPYLPVITPAGPADAFAISDISDDTFPFFYCFLDNQIVCIFRSDEVRRIKNVTMGGGTNDINKLFTTEQLARWEWARNI